MRAPNPALFAIALLVAAGCGGGDDDSTSTTEPTPSGQSDESSNPPGSEAGRGTISVDAGTFELVLTDCQLGAGGTSAFTITGATADGAYAFSAGGIAGAATIGFESADGTTIWAVAGGSPTIDGATFAYDGPALKTSDGGADPATTLRVDLQC